MRTGLILMLLVVLSGPSVLAQEPVGRELFTVHCQACHGPQGLGNGPGAKVLDPPPRNLTQRPYKQGCGPGAIVKTLRTGVPGSAMPSFEGVLNETEMWALGRYVRSLQQGCGGCQGCGK